MPPLIAAVAAYYATTTFMVYMAIYGAITLASIGYSAFMLATLQMPKLGSDATKRDQTVRSSVQPHRMIYGEIMTGGALVFAQSHDCDPWAYHTWWNPGTIEDEEQRASYYLAKNNTQATTAYIKSRQNSTAMTAGATFDGCKLIWNGTGPMVQVEWGTWTLTKNCTDGIGGNIGTNAYSYFTQAP